jgi:hypothetical protein
MIFENTETARYVCRRIYNFFVYSEIDEATEKNVIEPLADLFISNHFEIKPVLQTLLSSEHFYHEWNRGAIIKNPVDFFAGSWRSFNMLNPQGNIEFKGRVNRAIIWNMSEMGMELGDPPSVAGWPAYYQAPQFDKSWITTNTVTVRANKTDAMVYWGIWVDEENQIPIDLPEFVAQLPAPEEPNQMIRDSAVILLGIAVSDAVVENLKSVLLSGQRNDYYWTSAWNKYTEDPFNPENREVVITRLRSMFQYFLQLSEFQLG